MRDEDSCVICDSLLLPCVKTEGALHLNTKHIAHHACWDVLELCSTDSCQDRRCFKVWNDDVFIINSLVLLIPVKGEVAPCLKQYITRNTAPARVFSNR